MSKVKIEITEESETTYLRETKEAVVEVNGKQVNIARNSSYEKYGSEESDIEYGEGYDKLTEEEQDELRDFVYGDEMKW